MEGHEENTAQAAPIKINSDLNISLGRVSPEKYSPDKSNQSPSVKPKIGDEEIEEVPEPDDMPSDFLNQLKQINMSYEENNEPPQI